MSKTKFIDRTIEEQNTVEQVEFNSNEKKGAVTCKLYDNRTGLTFIGTTKVKNNDTFDERTGRNIAFCKARLQEIGHNKSELKSQLKRLTNIYEDFKSRIQSKISNLESDRELILLDLKSLSK